MQIHIIQALHNKMNIFLPHYLVKDTARSRSDSHNNDIYVYPFHYVRSVKHDGFNICDLVKFRRPPPTKDVSGWAGPGTVFQ